MSIELLPSNGRYTFSILHIYYLAVGPRVTVLRHILRKCTGPEFYFCCRVVVSSNLILTFAVPTSMFLGFCESFEADVELIVASFQIL